MIKYDLVCKKGHEFEGWFPSSADYDAQASAGKVVCPACGSKRVSKALMAPAIARHSRKSGSVKHEDFRARVQEFMTGLQKHVEKNCDYVGKEFPEEARRIHYGESETRGIYGEASVSEARDLVDEGIEVVPVPGIKGKAN